MYIAVSGNLGSGKTTIARGLANAFNCELYPRRSYNTSYIVDLFREPERWTTEAQIAFAVHKHAAIREGMSRGRFFVLDRTFEEEIQVFAERFHDDGAIDDRGIDLIRRIGLDLASTLESPSLIVFCDCPIEVSQQRLRDRPREYQRDYPSDHLSKLEHRLRFWIEQQRNVPILRVQTAAVDYRKREFVDALAHKIDSILTYPGVGQLDLFVGMSKSLDSSQSEREASILSLIRARKVYLAAPYTSRATRRVRPSADAVLFTGDEYAESIPSSYRGQLTSLANAIEMHGHKVLLPHRDINRWGGRALPAGEIAQRCLEAVEASDFFVGLIAESFGSHAELGYALGLGKPALILRSAKDPTSFFGAGMATMASVATLTAPSIAGLAKQLKWTDPLSIIQLSKERS